MKIQRDAQFFYFFSENIVAWIVEVDHAVDGAIISLSSDHYPNSIEFLDAAFGFSSRADRILEGGITKECKSRGVVSGAVICV